VKKLPTELAGGSRLKLLELIKAEPDLTVRQLAERLGMSYTGVKAQCLILERKGYLSARQRRRPFGRPEVLYVLREKARPLFPEGGVDVSLSLLDQCRKLFGPQAPEKVLFLHFQAQAEQISQAIGEGTISERAQALAAMRSAAGNYSQFDPGPPQRLIERHSPLAGLFKVWPQAMAMETAMLGRILGCSVRRVQDAGSEAEIIFLLGC
jgi:predicted ArsR family transcriptional regulator